MPISNTTTVSAPVNRVLSTKFIKDARPLCHYFLGSQPGDVQPAHRGTFNMLWRQYDNIDPTTTALTEDTGSLVFPIRPGTAIAVTDVAATVAKYGDHAFLTEELTLRDPTQAGLEIAEVFAVQGGRSLNRLQRNILEDFLTQTFAGAATAANEVVDTISIGMLEAAINTLDRNVAEPFTGMASGSNVVGSSPILPGFWGFTHPDVAVDIAKISGFKGVETYASHTTVHAGEFGMVMIAGKGVRFISTSEATIDASGGGTSGAVRNTAGTVNTYTTVIIGRRCHGALSLDVELIRETYKSGDKIPGLMLIETSMGSAGTADPMQEMKSVGWKAWHGGTILTANYGRALVTGASILS